MYIHIYTPSLPNKKRPNKKIGVYFAGHDIFLKVRKSNSSHRKNTCGKIQCLGLKPLDGHESGPQGTDLDENFGTPYHFLRRFRKSQSRGRFRPSRDRKLNFAFFRQAARRGPIFLPPGLYPARKFSYRAFAFEENPRLYGKSRVFLNGGEGV